METISFIYKYIHNNMKIILSGIIQTQYSSLHIRLLKFHKFINSWIRRLVQFVEIWKLQLGQASSSSTRCRSKHRL